MLPALQLPAATVSRQLAYAELSHVTAAVALQTVMAAGPPGAVPAAVQLTGEARVAAAPAAAAHAEQGPAVLQPPVNSPGHH